MPSLMSFFESIHDACSDKDLDERVWQVARTRRGGSEKEYYFNKLTRKSFWTLPPTAGALGDIISLSLALQFNKRDIDQFDFEGRIE